MEYLCYDDKVWPKKIFEHLAIASFYIGSPAAFSSSSLAPVIRICSSLKDDGSKTTIDMDVFFLSFEWPGQRDAILTFPPTCFPKMNRTSIDALLLYRHACQTYAQA